MKQFDQADLAILQSAFRAAAPSLPLKTRQEVEAALRQASLRLSMPLEQWHRVTAALSPERPAQEESPRPERSGAPGRAQAARKAQQEKRQEDTARLIRSQLCEDKSEPTLHERHLHFQLTRTK